MRKLRVALVAGMISVGSLAGAAPAQASCDTELGDMCKAMSVTCAAIERQSPKLADQLGCDRW